MAASDIAPEYLTLKQLSCYSGVSVRRIYDYLDDPVSPLSHYQPGGGKMLVKRSEFDEWMKQFRCKPESPEDEIVSEIVQSLRVHRRSEKRLRRAKGNGTA